MILGVAIMWDGTMYAMPRPARHHNIIWTHAKYEWNYDHPDSIRAEGEHEQGFYDELGNFLSRREAALHALLFGQMIDADGEMVDYIPRPPRVYSEDLWHRESELFVWRANEKR